MRKLVVSFLMLRLSFFYLIASPAYPDTIEFTQPDGTKILILLKGDEHLKWAETEDGYTLLINQKGFYEYATLNDQGDMICSGFIARNSKDRLRNENEYLSKVSKKLSFSTKQKSYARNLKQSLKSQTAANSFPTTGNLKLLCILMDFSDQPFTKAQTDFYNLFNQLNYSVDNAKGSVRDYYLENSYSQLDLSVTVVGPYRADSAMAYYGGNEADGDDTNPKALITEAVKKANPDVNYVNFDNNVDGTVDGIYVIYAGYGEEAGGPDDAIWAHAWSISTLSLDGKYIKTYSCSPELRSNSGTGITRIGVICHEFGHVLGASDFYDTNYETGEEFEGTGKWDVMAGGSWNYGGISPAHHNGYTKTKIYNWTTLTVLSTPATLTLQSAAQNANSYYRYNTPVTGEYFLCENRQQVGFDSYLPGHGLIIYHVHKDIGTTSINVTHPQKFYPVCANATTEPNSDPDSYGVINSGGTPFPGTSGKTAFTDGTLPSSKSWEGAITNKPVTNISENLTNKTITFDFIGGSTGNPISFEASAISQSQIELDWTKNPLYTNVLIAYNTTSVFGIPVNGNNYATGSTLSGGGTILYNGSLSSTMHGGLAASTRYYYKVWSVKPGNIYSEGLVTNEQTLVSTNIVNTDVANYRIYPNPSATIVYVICPDAEERNIAIVNYEGKLVLLGKLLNIENAIDLSGLHAGVYIVKIWNSKDLIMERLIKQ
jgi:M6 family metalloprotease-like protein